MSCLFCLCFRSLLAASVLRSSVPLPLFHYWWCLFAGVVLFLVLPYYRIALLLLVLPLYYWCDDTTGDVALVMILFPPLRLVFPRCYWFALLRLVFSAARLMVFLLLIFSSGVFSDWCCHFPCLLFVSVQHECIPQALLGMDVICQVTTTSPQHNTQHTTPYPLSLPHTTQATLNYFKPTILIPTIILNN